MEFEDVKNLLLYIGFNETEKYHLFEGIIAEKFYSISIIHFICIMDNVKDGGEGDDYEPIITYIDVDNCSYDEKYKLISTFFKSVIRKKKIKNMIYG